MNKTKVCTDCNRSLPIIEFLHSVQNGKPNYRKSCSACWNARRGAKRHSLKYWTVERDPDGDFTGKRFPATDIIFMLRLHSFSPGSVLVDPVGRRRVIE